MKISEIIRIIRRQRARAWHVVLAEHVLRFSSTAGLSMEKWGPFGLMSRVGFKVGRRIREFEPSFDEKGKLKSLAYRDYTKLDPSFSKKSIGAANGLNAKRVVIDDLTLEEYFSRRR